MVAVTASGGGNSQISSCSPIQTLERQYAAPVGNRCHILVHASASCCIEGGVEGILKLKAAGGGKGYSGGHSAEGGARNPNGAYGASNGSLTTNGGTHHPTAGAAGAAGAGAGNGDNPFDFLSEEQQGGGGAVPAPVLGGDPSLPNNAGGAKKKKGVFGFVKGVAKNVATSSAVSKGMSQLERGMHAVAVRAGGPDRQPDKFAVAVYDDSQPEPQILSCSEFVNYPSEVDRYRGFRFAVPLQLPPHLDGSPGRHVTIKLWIRSGSGLQALARNYLIGQAHFSVAQLKGTTGPTATTPARAGTQLPQLPPRFLTVELQSSLVVDGRLSLAVIPDPKFPPLAGRGWSLADPDTSIGYKTGHFNLPLDQSYGSAVANNINNGTSNPSLQPPAPPNSSSCWMVGTERAIESAVVLPIAAAVADAAARAGQISLRHAQECSAAFHHSRHDRWQAGAHDPTASYVDCNVVVNQLKLNGSMSMNGALFASGAPDLSVAWQRPGNVFEVKLLEEAKLPVQFAQGGTLVQAPSPQFRFYPKPQLGGPHGKALPTMVQARNASSAGFFLGNLRLSVVLPKKPTRAASPFDAAAASEPQLTNVQPVNPFEAAAAPAVDNHQLEAEGDVWECLVPLEPLLERLPKNPAAPNMMYPMEFAVISKITGAPVGMLAIQVSMQLLQQPAGAACSVTATSPPPLTTAGTTPLRGGLVSLMGLDMPVLGMPAALDVDTNAAATRSAAAAAADPERQRLKAQLSTMGQFVSSSYLEYHVQRIRAADVAQLQTRAAQYRQALQNALSPSGHTGQEPHEDRTPKPFRPSSSRMEQLLAGIGFNVHTASLSLNVLKENGPPEAGAAPVAMEGAAYYNITCGAPSDHARGFGNVFASPSNSKKNMKKASSSESLASSHSATASGTTAPTMDMPTQAALGLNSPVGSVSGGLRRLEAKRRELVAEVARQQAALCQSIGAYIMQERAKQQQQSPPPSGGPTPPHPVTHVPTNHSALESARWRLFEAVQSLHHVTWICSVRRAAVFSQALGIAVSSYLASLSDPAKAQSSWPALWAQHGYLITFEGLLSAAGKELGMIEDASVGIEMLKQARVVLVPDDVNDRSANVNDGRVFVPFSPYLKWVRLAVTGSEQETTYTLDIGMTQSYYDQRIPDVLKNGRAVPFYPLLFEVGVDIRQWGANKESKIMKKNHPSASQSQAATVSGDLSRSASNITTESEEDSDVASGVPNVGLLDDDDDDGDDAGIADNDVLVQLNYEAFQKLNLYAFNISPANSSNSQQKVHPHVDALLQHIRQSAGVMNYEILLEASALAQQMGGGSAIFCKSGKDRTAMHVTYKQAQFSVQYRQRHNTDPAMAAANTIFPDATLMRVHGTRLPICEKNVGQAKYAFNSLQLKFMPEQLRPPMHTLAGFLKGGKVFQGGGIES